MPSRDQMDSMLAHAPKWVSTDSFEIHALANGIPTKDQMRLMLQSLLADRFRLQVHIVTVQVPVLALVLEKPGKTGPKLRPHSEGPPCDVHLLGRPGCTLRPSVLIRAASRTPYPDLVTEWWWKGLLPPGIGKHGRHQGGSIDPLLYDPLCRELSIESPVRPLTVSRRLPVSARPAQNLHRLLRHRFPAGRRNIAEASPLGRARQNTGVGGAKAAAPVAAP